MNAQQSHYAKITLLATVVLLLIAVALVPRHAFAAEGDGQGEPAAATEGGADKAVRVTAGEVGSVQVKADAEQRVAKNDPLASTVSGNGECSDPESGETGGEQDGDEGDEPAAERDGDSAVNVLGSCAVKHEPAQASSKALTAQAASRTSTANVGLAYNTHVQNDGWQAYVGAGEQSGTTGRSLRLEGIHLSLTGMGNNSGHINYQTHVQNVGWQGTASDGAMAGTTGQSLRLEGIKIWLSGDIANHYDVFYRTHVQNIGWQGWQKNGAVSGTTGQSLRLEAIQIRLSAKTEEAAGGGAGTTGVRYETHVQNVGWQEWTGDGATAGTTGQSLRVEALNILLSGGAYSGQISYQVHVQNVGWQNPASDGASAGTTGQSLRVEALRVSLSGEVSKHYDVYYRTHVQNYGWLDWAVNGEDAGSTGHALRVEALQIVLKKKGEAAPGPTDCPSVNKLKSTLNGIDISSWQKGINTGAVSADFVIVKATGGTGYVNPYWRSMASQALGSGKLLGLYHFAREYGYRGTPEEEADFFTRTVSGYVGQAVLVLDYEAEAIDQGPSWAKRFLDRVYANTRVRPMIYMSKSVTRSQNWSSVASSYTLWVAQYPNYDTTGYQTAPWTDGFGYGAWNAPTMFQYTSTGRISGYNGNLDLNKFYGSQADWRNLAAKK